MISVNGNLRDITRLSLLITLIGNETTDHIHSLTISYNDVLDVIWRSDSPPPYNITRRVDAAWTIVCGNATPSEVNHSV